MVEKTPKRSLRFIEKKGRPSVKLYTVPEIADILQVSIPTVYRYLKMDLKGIRLSD